MNGNLLCMEERDNPFSDFSNFSSVSKLHLRDELGPAENHYRMTWKEIRNHAKNFLPPYSCSTAEAKSSKRDMKYFIVLNKHYQ